MEVFEVQQRRSTLDRITKRRINFNNNSVVCGMVAYDVAVAQGRLNWSCGEVTD
jgi:hypothetical protein